MKVTYFEWFSLEWSKACYKLNPTEENKKKLNDIVKKIKEKKPSKDEELEKEISLEGF